MSVSNSVNFDTRSCKTASVHKVQLSTQNSSHIARLIRQFVFLNCVQSIEGIYDCNHFHYESYVYWTVHHCDSWRIRDQLDVTCYVFYFTSSMLIMFRTLIHPSSGACDFFYWITTFVVCSCFDVCWSFGVGWYPCSRFQPATRISPHTSHTETPTHIETRTHDKCGDSIEKVAGSWWWMY